MCLFRFCLKLSNSVALAIGVAAALAVLFAVPSFAVTISNSSLQAVYSTTTVYDSTVSAYPSGGEYVAGTATLTDANGSGSATTSYGSATSSPSVSASVTLNANVSGTINANAYLTYSFEVSGGTKDSSAAVDVTTSGTATASGGIAYGNAAASILIGPSALLQPPYGPFGQFDYAANLQCNTGACFYQPNQSDFAFSNYVFDIPLDEPIYVAIEASATGDVALGTSGTIAATLDPNISLDSTDPSGLSLSFSPNINQPGQSQPSNVPEPASFLLFGTGILALMLLRHRRI